MSKEQDREILVCLVIHSSVVQPRKEEECLNL